MSKVEVFGGKVLKFEGVPGSFVTGLQWRHEDVMPKAGALAETARLKGLGSLGGIRKTNAGGIQSFFSDPIDNAPSGKLVSLAAIVADHKDGSWMGVYKISDDLFWYIAVREGGILPDGDCIGDADSIGLLRESHLDLGSWKEVSGGIDDLVEIIRGYKGKKFALGKLTSSLLFMIQLLGVVVALIAIGGCVLLYQSYSDKRNAIERHNAMSKQKEMLENLKKSRKTPVVFPWSKKVSVEALFSGCHSAWEKQKISTAGWTLSQWDCSVDDLGHFSIATKWNRTGGFANFAPGDLVQNSDKESLLVETGVIKNAPTGIAGSLSNEQTNKRSLWAIAEKASANLSIYDEKAPSKIVALPGMVDPNTPHAIETAWITKQYVIEFALSPMIGSAVSRDLSSIGILSANKLEWNGTWKLYGDIYSDRK